MAGLVIDWAVMCLAVYIGIRIGRREERRRIERAFSAAVTEGD